MKKISLLILFALPMLLIGCVSAPHRADKLVMKTYDGKTQVKIQLHEDDPTEIGSPIGAYEKKCRTINRRDNDLQSCSYYLIGMGRIIDLNLGSATVEFPSSVAIKDQTIFENSSKM